MTKEEAHGATLLSIVRDRIEASLEATELQAGLLVAWSGGLDSTVLVDVLRRWARQRQVELAAVHVDHGLSPVSRRAASSCRRQAARWGLTLLVEELDVEQRGSLQESARIQRYSAIAQAAARLGMTAVATAHHADDALETALINFRRGSSAGGLASLFRTGEPPLPSWPDLCVLRPLVHVPRARLRAHAEQHDLSWCEDPSNQATTFERNRLRHRVMPELVDQDAAREPMLRTLENLAHEARALDHVANQLFDEAHLAPPDTETLAFRRESLRNQPQAIVVRVLQEAAERLPTEVGWSREHLRDALEAIQSRRTRFRMSVRGARFTVDRGLVAVEVSRGRGGRDLDQRSAQPIRMSDSQGGTLPWFGTELTYDWIDPHAHTAPAADEARRVWLDADALEHAPLVRGARPGERISPHDFEGRKRVSDVLAEAGVPASLRWRWPCVVQPQDDGDQNLQWVAGLRSSKAPADSERVLQMCWKVPTASIFNITEIF